MTEVKGGQLTLWGVTLEIQHLKTRLNTVQDQIDALTAKAVYLTPVVKDKTLTLSRLNLLYSRLQLDVDAWEAVLEVMQAKTPQEGFNRN